MTAVLEQHDAAAPQSLDERPLWELLVAPSSFGDPRRTIVHAAGHALRFADGNEVLDGTSGLWNVNLGYGNAAVAEAVGRTALDASYMSLFRYGHRHARDAACALLRAAGRDQFARVVFSTSGGAANDLVMKIVRQYAQLRGQANRRLVVGLKGSYHGLTFGSFALTGDELGQAAYGVDQRLVRHVDWRDARELRQLLAREGGKIAAVVVEPVLGSGAHVLPDELLEALLEGRQEHGFLLVADEVATGFGRTGPMFASESWPAAPDVLVTSKGLTNGTCAAAAVLVSPAVAAAFDDADAVLVHGETQAGTPITCAAILATLGEFERLDALASGRRAAAVLDAGLRLLLEHPRVASLSGRGLFRAVHLKQEDGSPVDEHEVGALVTACRDRGLVVHPGPGCLQLLPALTFTDAEIARLLDVLTRVVQQATAS